MGSTPKPFNPDLGASTLLSRFEPFHGSDAMPSPSAQTAKKLLGGQRQQRMRRCLHLVFSTNPRCQKFMAADLYPDESGELQRRA